MLGHAFAGIAVTDSDALNVDSVRKQSKLAMCIGAVLYVHGGVWADPDVKWRLPLATALREDSSFFAARATGHQTQFFQVRDPSHSTARPEPAVLPGTGRVAGRVAGRAAAGSRPAGGGCRPTTSRVIACAARLQALQTAWLHSLTLADTANL